MSFGTKSISLLKALCLALVVVCFFALFMPWLSSRGLIGMRSVAGVFSTGINGRFISFWSVMLIINAVFFILLAGLAVFGLITDKGGLVFPAAFVAVIMFFLALFQNIYISRDLHLGLGAWLMLLLGMGIPGLILLDNALAKKPLLSAADFGFKARAPKESKGGWTCPTCGVKQSAAMKFCDRCGTQKPEPPHCPACGALIHPGEAFCSNCGAEI